MHLSATSSVLMVYILRVGHIHIKLRGRIIAKSNLEMKKNYGIKLFLSRCFCAKTIMVFTLMKTAISFIVIWTLEPKLAGVMGNSIIGSMHAT